MARPKRRALHGALAGRQPRRSRPARPAPAFPEGASKPARNGRADRAAPCRSSRGTPRERAGGLIGQVPDTRALPRARALAVEDPVAPWYAGPSRAKNRRRNGRPRCPPNPHRPRPACAAGSRGDMAPATALACGGRRCPAATPQPPDNQGRAPRCARDSGSGRSGRRSRSPAAAGPRVGRPILQLMTDRGARTGVVDQRKVLQHRPGGLNVGDVDGPLGGALVLHRPAAQRRL